MSSGTPVVRSELRNFGHCIVSWTIKNYFLAACNPGTVIKTEPFFVHSSQDTHWLIGFRVDKTCQVLLRRLSDKADESIEVTWRVTMFDMNDEDGFCEDIRFRFKQNSQKAINVPDPSTIPQVLDSDLGEVRIQIQMIVFMNGRVEIPKLSNSHQQSLVNDLQSAARRKLYSDLTIYLNVKAICGHRAMLLTRSKTLEQAEGDTNTRTYCVHHDDTEAFYSLVRYLYTSDLLHIFETPSFAMYRLIVDLHITELLHSYPQEKITMETTIEATEFVYSWTIPALIYNDNRPNNNICEVYEANCSYSKDMDWQIRVSPKEVAGNAETRMKYVRIEASLVNNTRPQDVVVCVKARNRDDPVTVVKREYAKIERGMNLKTKFKRIANPSVPNSYYSLFIYFSVHIGTGAKTFIITEASPPVGFWLTPTSAFRILQGRMENLFENSLYSDVTLLVEEHKFKCHKFLLAARSSAFYKIFKKKPDASLEFRNINRNVFGVFLFYLYTGALPNFEQEWLSVIFLMHLYDLSMNFTVGALTSLCLERLTSELSTQNACCMLVFTDERRLTRLRASASQFFSIDSHIAIHDQCKRRLQKKNPELFRSLRIRYFSASRSEFDVDSKLSIPDRLGLNAMIK